MEHRIGTGWDTHRLVEGRKLVLGGITVPFERGEAGHSDGDVLIHAIIDALLGAAAAGDIGTHFPPTDAEYKDISSRILLERTRGILGEKGYRIINVDSTVVLEQPKLGPYIGAIRETLSQDLGVPEERISVKAKSAEGLGAVGAGEAVEAFAAVILTER